MIKVKNIEVLNIRNAINGMRNPLESWDKSDSYYDTYNNFIIGKEDLKLAKKLILAGSDHSKFMRQIFVSMDITAPMTWWWDFDTYKISTVKNSTSRMHKLGTRLLTYDDFSFDNENKEINISPLRKNIVDNLNERILQYQELKNKDINLAMKLWREIVFDLPQSYNFLATWTGNYQNLRNIYHGRENHKQREFKDFCKILKTLPYSEFITLKTEAL